MDVDQIGEYLEHRGATDEEIDDFLEHFGVKGMKWGVRRQQKAVARANERSKNKDRFGNRNNMEAQMRLDRLKRVAKGKASLPDVLRVALLQTPDYYFYRSGFSLKGASKLQLDQAAKYQKKVMEGKKRVSDKLLRLEGIDVRELNYSL